MEKQILTYLEMIRNDYKAWKNRMPTTDKIQEQIREEMTKEFCESLTFEAGRKYIKVLQGQSVHSFIVKADDKTFKKGDILKAASFNAPAKNFARGNILKGGYKVAWTGA